MAAYGGLEGLARQPMWVARMVLKAFFSEDDAKAILDYVRSRKKAEGSELDGSPSFPDRA